LGLNVYLSQIPLDVAELMNSWSPTLHTAKLRPQKKANGHWTNRLHNQNNFPP